MSGSMRSRRLSGHKKPTIDAVRNDINVTPLVDVVLVLLIIFMVISQLMVRGQSVPDLPKTRNHSQEKDKLQPVISLDKEAVLWFDKDKLGAVNDESLKRLSALVRQSWDAPKSPQAAGKVYVKADGNLRYEQVAPLILYLNTSDLGIQSIDLATNEIKGKI
jgi:biopolymer transport protein TolR